MNNETREDLLETCRRLEAEIDAASPNSDPARLTRIRFLCSKLCGRTDYLTEKANRFERLAAIYLSARKHISHPGGAEALMQEMRHELLDNMREQIERLSREAGL